MKLFLKSLLLFGVLFGTYYGTSVYMFEKQSEQFVSDLVSAINDNQPELLAQYKTMEYDLRMLEGFSDREYTLFKDTPYNYQTLVDSAENIRSVQVVEITDNINHDFIFLTGVNCYDLTFNNNLMARMIMCTQQIIGEVEVALVQSNSV
jgi:hypothetical protein